MHMSETCFLTIPGHYHALNYEKRALQTKIPLWLAGGIAHLPDGQTCPPRLRAPFLLVSMAAMGATPHTLQPEQIVWRVLPHSYRSLESICFTFQSERNTRSI